MNKKYTRAGRHFLGIVVLMLFCFSSPVPAGAQTGPQGTFVAGKDAFLLNGKPFVIRAAELHYPRIPKAYWEQRIRLCKAMGMNTICIYLFWNFHEQEPGVFQFSGQQDVAAFVRLIQKNGMYCIVRPGPYICAEWDMGGLPWWLLKKKDLQVRTNKDSVFMQRTRLYLDKVIAQLAPLQIQHGGNIIMAQVENEYGVWGNDEVYMAAMRDQIRSAGFDKVQLFRCDWSSNFDRYQLPGVASTLNFGAGSNIDEQFKKFKQVNPGAPLMCSEYWTGWFDQWGRPHETRGVNTFIGSLKDMLDRKISFSLYMAHGGTSFGQWAGANAAPYAPTVSSYDYDAPINEAGGTTDKFFAIRELIKSYLQEGEQLPAIPANPSPLISLDPISFTRSAALFDNLPVPKKTVEIQPMEMFDQGWGRILYRTTISACDRPRKLVITEVHDWAVVFVNGKKTGKIDRRTGGNMIDIPAVAAGAQLDILVETSGRVNYGKAIIDRKGITERVVLADGNTSTTLQNWLVYNFPVDAAFQEKANYTAKTVNGPAWYKAFFTVQQPGDTYLDLSTWGKGMVWVNGYNLGRFWQTGPTQSMYLPGSWLKKGKNEIIILDVDQPDTLQVRGLKAPVYAVSRERSLLHRREGQQLDLSAIQPVIQGTFTPDNGWKQVLFPGAAKGRYFCLEALNAQEQGDVTTSVAEIEILLEDGTVASTLKWKVLYADSEEVTTADHSADKLFDMQESVIWETASVAKTRHPHAVVIDMGEVLPVKGFRILPRDDKSKAGMIKDYRFYLSPAPFKYGL